MAKAEFVQDVKDLGKVYADYAPLHTQLADFRKIGINSLVSVRDVCFARLYGKDFLKDGTRTCHAPVGAKDSPIIVVRDSPVMGDLRLAKRLVHANGNFDYLTQPISVYREYEKIAKQDKRKRPEKRRAIFLPSKDNFDIHLDSDEAKFFWQDTRKPYFKDFVQRDSVRLYNMNLNLIDNQDKTKINYLWFGRVDNDSILNCGDRDLDNNHGAFGVKEKTGEAGSQTTKANLPYSDEDLILAQKELEALGISGLGNMIISPLEKEILEALRKQ